MLYTINGPVMYRYIYIADSFQIKRIQRNLILENCHLKMWTKLEKLKKRQCFKDKPRPNDS